LYCVFWCGHIHAGYSDAYRLSGYTGFIHVLYPWIHLCESFVKGLLKVDAMCFQLLEVVYWEKVGMAIDVP
jgi:hypothetical protein